jgi:hypothetical protein
MALKDNGRLSRRELMRALSMCGAGVSVAPFLSSCRQTALTPQDQERLGTRKSALGAPPKFLIVVTASGGGSLVDSFLAVRQSESSNAANLNTYADADVITPSGSNFRAVKYSASGLGSIPIPVTADQTAFVTKHFNEMLVATTLGTSVNHVVAQKRSLTGNGAWKGRTLQECVALEYGDGFPLPNVNMGYSGYLERGDDDTLPAYCYGETVANPALWPLGLDGVKGLKGAPDRDLVQLARNVRNDKLDPESVFGITFQNSPRLQRWYAQRGDSLQKLEAMDLITKLNILPDMPPQTPLTEYGLSASPDAAQLRQVFPNFFTDTFEGQAAAAFLLLKYRVSVAVTIGPSFNVVVTNTIANPPLAFDFSHQDLRGSQAFMWNRLTTVIDRLITLLQAEPYDTTSGTSLWDHTLIYVATDFGRSKQRPANATSFGAGHDLDNGFLMLSPMLKGNTVLGGVNPNDLTSYKFDTETGAQVPTNGLSNERDVFAGVVHTLGVDTSGSGLPDAKAFRKGA